MRERERERERERGIERERGREKESKVRQTDRQIDGERNDAIKQEVETMTKTRQCIHINT